MASMKDLARSMAAGAPMGASAEGPGESGLADLMAEGSEMSVPEAAGDPVMDFEAGVEQAASAVEALPEAVKEQARQHIEALRQLVQQAGAASEGEGAPPEAEALPPTDDPGLPPVSE